jgi:hypothetical protein
MKTIHESRRAYAKIRITHLVCARSQSAWRLLPEDAFETVVITSVESQEVGGVGLAT